MITVLLVDDSRVTREVTKVFLISKDIEVVDARNGEDALRLIRERPPSIVVTDLQMPKLDGPGLCAALRSDPALADIPVVILTSNVDKASADRCLKAGAREVLTKPVQPADLLASLRRHTSLR